MPTTPAAVTEMLEQLPAYRESFAMKELRRLPDLLEQGETIRALTHGYYDGGKWLVVVTQRRVLMVDDDMLGSGYRSHALAVDRVQDVGVHVDFGSADITIKGLGVSYRVTATPKSSAPLFVQTLQELARGAQEPAASRANGQGAYRTPGVDDPLAPLERLVQLRREGMLTDAEFTAAKARLLGL